LSLPQLQKQRTKLKKNKPCWKKKKKAEEEEAAVKKKKVEEEEAAVVPSLHDGEITGTKMTVVI